MTDVADKDFTQRDLEIMAKAWSCMTEEPKVNYEKLAAACGMGNPRSAANAWRTIKSKIVAKGKTFNTSRMSEHTSKANILLSNQTPRNACQECILMTEKAGITKPENSEENGDATPAKKATPRKRGRAAAAATDEGADDDGESPTKKTKGGKKTKGTPKKSAAKVAEDEEEGDEKVKKEEGEEDRDGEGVE